MTMELMTVGGSGNTGLASEERGRLDTSVAVGDNGSDGRVELGVRRVPTVIGPSRVPEAQEEDMTVDESDRVVLASEERVRKICGEDSDGEDMDIEGSQNAGGE